METSLPLNPQPLKTLADRFTVYPIVIRPASIPMIGRPSGTEQPKDLDTWPMVWVEYTYPGVWVISRRLNADDEVYEEARVTDERMLPQVVAALLGQSIDEEQHD